MKIWKLLKILFFLGAIVGAVLFLFTSSSKKGEKREERVSLTPSHSTPSIIKQPSKRQKAKEIKECAFVVYWLDLASLKFDKYDKYLYFGIAPDLNGKIAKDQGFKKINSFVKFVENKNKALVVRLVDKRLAQEFLTEEEIWESFLDEVFSLAAQKGFSEVSFDIELSPFQENLKGPLVEFLSSASRKAKEYKIKISFIAYADSFYRKRPFDFEKISKLVDEVYLMAYDFTKPISEPGPNFPLEKGKWGYSLLQAIEDFSRYFGREKITVVFGMYGKDWFVNEDRIPYGKAKVLTLRQIKKKYLEKCTPDKCVVKLNPVAKEKELNIVFSKLKEGRGIMYPHIVWFEDEESVKEKKKALKEKGVSSFCYFALGYY